MKWLRYALLKRFQITLDALCKFSAFLTATKINRNYFKGLICCYPHKLRLLSITLIFNLKVQLQVILMMGQ